jgi:Na+-transporting methylmalonyl-CoA/oxaloacetate decarboxylase gamma subunit
MTPVDWAFAGKVGGVGFGLVFAVLIILALALWGVGAASKRWAKPSAPKDKTKPPV